MRAIRDTAKDDRPLSTEWFETEAQQPIVSPPRLHSSCNVKLGDLFLHYHGSETQIWLRISGSHGDDCWVPIDIGHVREDGRRLTLTPKMQVPSWVGKSWGSKRMSASEYCGYMFYNCLLNDYSKWRGRTEGRTPDGCVLKGCQNP